MINQKSEKLSLYSKLVNHILLLYPILNTYALVGSLSIARAVLLSLVCIFIFRIVTKKQRPMLYAPKKFNAYCKFWFFSAVFSISFIGISVLSALPGIIYSTLFMLLFFYEADFRYLLKWYKYYAIAFIGFFFFQEFLYMATGVRVPGLIPGLSLTVTEEIGSDRYMDMILYGYRSTSVFSEPAHFAQWLLPLLSIELMFDKSKKHFLFAGAIVLALLLLRSGNAMFGLAVVLLCFLLYLFFENKSRYRFLILVAFVLALVVGGAYYLKSEAASDVLDRQGELQLTGDTSDMMGQVRLYRGYFVFAEYNFLEQMIGMSDVPKLLNYIKTSKVAMFFEDHETYFNAIQSILLKTGYIGLIIFIWLCIDLSRRSNYAGKAIVWSFFALSFVSGLFFIPTMALYLVLAYKLKLNNEQKKYYVQDLCD